MEASVKLIAHRGNTKGSLPKRENTVAYIEEAIENGFDVEIDERATELKGIEKQMSISPYKYILGHHEGENEVSYEWLLSHYDKLWIRCKEPL